ncbi:UDP-N-acetylmuramoyl-tripeptide--D-alanyl-D-alanine ligase [Lentilactobacillus sp. SPB1-3]|uniref:UDP-N-acetylmuramoyl-tripeptide--D-alanyl-D-alanine ligase n=1 Tax=Lentilactobacillus terminaliae TaxID=3003483 RepID=A0ACD5DGR7_9LACO|nr:UDP-N-acetylmuramoyl-tripeptide--D-alanyl-D-alanine ligase [Lentilactobacillus sp. SPB1-3]MCZ0977920.1 UDP-N-acetylmuramoyl-tripeptide--D-alanyl-D-alanine ligase [Lentilactobacillus sp. SPB1-3]
MKMTIAEIAQAIDADTSLISKENLTKEITSVDFDSRNITEGGLFIPLLGEKDGHNYIESAAANGAGATLFAKDHENQLPVAIPALLVDDPLKSFQTLSKYYLQKINPRVIAVTGSNGKTTTKDMIAAVLSAEFNVVKTHDNFNNEIGVPYTLLQMESNTEFLVVELGMDRPMQLDFLSKLVEPDVALITMIGEAHIEFFKTRDKIADAKMEITHGLKEDGIFIYDGDEPLLRERAKDLSVRTMTFGSNTENDIYPTKIDGEKFETNFTTNLWPDMEMTIPLIGDYNVNNALMAILVGKIFRIHEKLISEQLKHVQLTKNRTEWLEGKLGEAILSDVYNSNPTAALEVLKTINETPVSGRRVIVLGDMLELGEQSLSMHASLAKNISLDKDNQIYLIGKDIQALADELRPQYDNTRLHIYQKDQLDKLAADLIVDMQPNDTVLLKASHGIHLEQVVAKLVK